MKKGDFLPNFEKSLNSCTKKTLLPGIGKTALPYVVALSVFRVLVRLHCLMLLLWWYSRILVLNDTSLLCMFLFCLNFKHSMTIMTYFELIIKSVYKILVDFVFQVDHEV